MSCIKKNKIITKNAKDFLDNKENINLFIEITIKKDLKQCK